MCLIENVAMLYQLINSNCFIEYYTALKTKGNDCYYNLKTGRCYDKCCI